MADLLYTSCAIVFQYFGDNNARYVVMYRSSCYDHPNDRIAQHIICILEMFAEFLIEVQKHFAYKLLYLHMDNLLLRHYQRVKTSFLVIFMRAIWYPLMYVCGALNVIN